VFFDYVFPSIIGLVLVVLVFSAGFYIAKAGWIDNLVYGDGTDRALTVRDFSNRMGEVAGILDDKSIYDYDIDAVTSSAITELLASSDDGYAVYYTEEQYEQTQEVNSGAYTGLGVKIADVAGYVMIAGVYDGSPAAQAGVKAGDIIIGVDGDTHAWTFGEMTDALHRAVGDQVELELFRPTEDSLAAIGEKYHAASETSSGKASASTDAASASIDAESADTATTDAASAGAASTSTDAASTDTQPVSDAVDVGAYQGDTFTVQITYAEITIPNVTSALKDGGVGYITIAKFNGLTADTVAGYIGDLTAQGATSIVIDLRNDPGGLADQAVDAASLFLDDGSTVMQIKYKNSSDVKKTSRAAVTDLPLVVLVNQNSASASEIFAAAVKDNGRATLVGTTTYGKGIMQDTTKLSFGGAIKFTFATYLGPNGEAINGIGITPDIVVEAADSAVDAESDPQLDAALAEARRLASAGA